MAQKMMRFVSNVSDYDIFAGLVDDWWCVNDATFVLFFAFFINTRAEINRAVSYCKGLCTWHSPYLT